MPGDQRPDDAGSACFDTSALTEPIEILGRPRVTLTLSVDAREAMIAVRLNTVAPDGAVARVTYGLLNLAHRDGFDRARPLMPGERVTVAVPLKMVGFRVPAGHRLRLAMSTQYWPLAMPLPSAATVTLHGGSLSLPQRHGPDIAAPDLGVAWSPPPLPVQVLTPPMRGRIRMTHEVASGAATLEVVRNLGAINIADTGVELRALGSERYSVLRDDPATARSEAVREAGFHRNDWNVRIVTRSTLVANGPSWRLQATLDAFDEDVRVFSREWTIDVPRL
jgi:hypothetical protein